ncbi:MAG: anthranilate phosphoribosyltransferase [Planctomycetes bacterium]|nr:anthranilate phosphoribosyltransferase [Planctomycetota bacterium]
MRETLEKLLKRTDLTVPEAEALALALLNPETPDVQIAAALAALHSKGENAGELQGFIAALMSLAKTIARDGGIRVDTCGTGGDGAGTFNISTAAALVCAAAGEPIFKHGNRAASSKCGSADVIEALGIPFTDANGSAGAPAARFHFLFAPNHHPALRRLAPIRKALAFRTIFNLVGPLANPAFPTHQLVGVGVRERLTAVANTLAASGSHAMVVWGEPGLDEATPAGAFDVLRVANQSVTPSRMTAADFGLPACKLEDLCGGDAAENAKILSAIFAGEKSPRRDTVVLNAALVFMLTGREKAPQAAVRLAAQMLDSGAVAALVAKLKGGGRG